MDKRIIDFIEKEKVLTLATANEKQPYCANCFYAFLKEGFWLVFMSSEYSRHTQEALNNKQTAGTIYKYSGKIILVKGIQFTGQFSALNSNLLTLAKKAYFKRYPFARLMEGQFYGIQLHYIKMTDNSWGIGKKLIWEIIKGTSKNLYAIFFTTFYFLY